MATKKSKLTFTQNEQNEKEVKPYCEKAAIAVDAKEAAEAEREKATKALKAQLDSDPETKTYTGTVVYIFNGIMYKIRVQRPDNTDWLSKRLKDPDLKELKTVEKKISELEKRSKELKEQLSQNHPKCLDKGFVIGYLK